MSSAIAELEVPSTREQLRAWVKGVWSHYLTGDSLRSRIARGAFWCVLGTGVSQALGLLATVVCARLLGSALYGQLGIVLTTVNLFATVASVGLGVTATKHVAEYWRHDPRHAGRIIAMSSMVSAVSGSAIAILLIALAPWLSRSTLKAPLAAELQLGAVMMLFAAVNGYQTGTLAGFEAFKTQAVLNAIRGFVACPAIVTGVALGGLRGAMVAYTATSAVTFLIHEIAIRRECRLHFVPLSYRVEKADLRLLWSFSIPVLIASFSFTPAVWWTSAMLGAGSAVFYASNVGHLQRGAPVAGFRDVFLERRGQPRPPYAFRRPSGAKHRKVQTDTEGQFPSDDGAGRNHRGARWPGCALDHVPLRAWVCVWCINIALNLHLRGDIGCKHLGWPSDLVAGGRRTGNAPGSDTGGSAGGCSRVAQPAWGGGASWRLRSHGCGPNGGAGAVPAGSYAQASSSLARLAKSRRSRCAFAKRLIDAARCRLPARHSTIRWNLWR